MNWKTRTGAICLLVASALSVPAAAYHWEDDQSDERERERDDRSYQRGARYLDRKEWDKAAESFTQVIENKGSKTDGALYWRAYAENRMGRRSESLKTLEQLVRDHPNSRWLNDAKALMIEVRQASNQGVNPDATADDDMKLIVINGLMSSDPQRAFPLLEKVLTSSNSPKVKERALFVMAQSGSQQASEVLARIAKGGGNPDLQAKAIEYLGVFGRGNAALLGEIYESTPDVAIRRRILSSFMTMGDRERLLSAAKSEKNADLRRQAIDLLGAAGGRDQLWQLYRTEQEVELRRSILRGLFVAGDFTHLAEVMKTEKDAQLRKTAVHQLGVMGKTKTGDLLAAAYASEQDRDVRREILQGLFVQGNVKALIDAAKREQDQGLKREAVQKLSTMHSKEATDYLMELLKD